MRNDGREGAFGRECADVQLVNDEIPHRDAAPPIVGPLECIWIDDARRTMYAVRLKTTHWIGQRLVLIVEEIAVLATGRGVAHDRFEDSVVPPRQLVLALVFTR